MLAILHFLAYTVKEGNQQEEESLQLMDRLSKRKISRVKLFCALFFLIVLELAAVSGRINGVQSLRNSLNTEGQRQLTLSGIRKSGEKTEPAGLWSGRQLETVSQASTGRQRSVIRIMTRSHAIVCGLLLLCFFPVFIHLIFRYRRKKLHSYTEKIISYLYHIAYM